jgi:hypothetical protein
MISNHYVAIARSRWWASGNRRYRPMEDMATGSCGNATVWSGRVVPPVAGADGR